MENKVSVVMSTFDRDVYLKRSLFAYTRCFHSVPLEIVVIDDSSNDGTQGTCEYFSNFLDLKYIKMFKPKGVTWRDCAATINAGIRFASGEFVIATHPEVIPGENSIQWMIDHARDGVYLANKIYYLTPSDQVHLDEVDWKESNLAVRKLPGFYNTPSTEHRGNPAYSHENTDETDNWESWVFGGMTKATWKFMGGFQESPAWGTVDIDFMARRGLLGVRTETAMHPNTFCIHQNHDVKQEGAVAFAPTPRDMELAHKTANTYHSPEEARLGHI